MASPRPLSTILRDEGDVIGHDHFPAAKESMWSMGYFVKTNFLDDPSKEPVAGIHPFKF